MRTWRFEGHDLDELCAALGEREYAYRVQDPRWDCGATYGERITGQPSVWPSN